VDSRAFVADGHDTRKLQLLRRELNEQLRRFSRRDGQSGSLRLLCECGRCREEIDVATERFERANANGGRWFVKDGHPVGAATPQATTR